ncbi:MAG: hypothetical protein VKJ64_05110 [Leptolyngbyaceae bacterium]|nr:hypothetical protein [Leptolyngbyaceae bacterium]
MTGKFDTDGAIAPLFPEMGLVEGRSLFHPCQPFVGGQRFTGLGALTR